MNFILSLLTLAVMGTVLTFVVIRRTKYRCEWPEFFALSFLIGMGITTFQFFIYYLTGVKITLQSVSIVSFVFALAAVYVLTFKRPLIRQHFLPLKPFQGITLLEKALFLGIVLQVAWTIFLVLPVGVHSHDAVANYALKAKIFYFAKGIPPGFFNWPETVVAHPDYPPLLPFLLTRIYAFLGFNDILINIVMPVIYAAFLAFFYVLMRKAFSRFYSLLVTFLLATIPQVADYATIIHADLILFVFITCAFLYFMLYIRNMEKGHLIFSSLLFAFSLWIKNEAVVFVAAFLLICAISGKVKWSDILIVLAIITIISAPWFVIKASSGMVNSDMDFSKVTPGRVWQNVKDIPILLNLFQQEVFGPKKWNIFWIAFFGCAVWKWKLLWKKENLYMSAFLILSAAGYFAAYMLTTGENLFFYVNTTISRFMLHFSGVCMVLLANLIKDDVNEREVRIPG